MPILVLLTREHTILLLGSVVESDEGFLSHQSHLTELIKVRILISDRLLGDLHLYIFVEEVRLIVDLRGEGALPVKVKALFVLLSTISVQCILVEMFKMLGGHCLLSLFHLFRVLKAHHINIQGRLLSVTSLVICW